MSRGAIADWLRREGASEDVAVWASAYGEDLGALWAACPRADWMLAIAARLGLAPRLLFAAARPVVGLALDVLPEEDAALSLVSSLGEDDPALAEVADALEARSDQSGDPAVQAALLGVACLLRIPSAPENAAMVPALTTQALVLDAGACATLAVVSWSQRTAADRVREVIGVADITALG